MFTIVFLVEGILKFIAFGLSYFNNSWNKFDFFIVAASIFDVILELSPTSSGGGAESFLKIAKVLRILRVARVVRLMGKAKSLQAIL